MGFSPGDFKFKPDANPNIVAKIKELSALYVKFNIEMTKIDSGEVFLIAIKDTNPVRESKELDKPTPTVADLAEKYHCSLLMIQSQLKKGIKVEMEHTSHFKVAKEIALDHLGERLDYYEKIAQFENEKDSDEAIPNEPVSAACRRSFPTVVLGLAVGSRG